LNRLDRSAVMLTLASGIAHEMGTPLAVIHGRAEQLLSRDLDERTTAHLTTIVSQVQRIQNVVQGFLHLARGGALSLETVDPWQAVESACRLVEHRFQSGGVRLEMLAPGTSPSIRCNRLLLEHALINLLLNARDACAGGGNVEVSLLTQPNRLSFLVTDDGEGIAPEVATRVTEAFFSTKPEGKGTGLGLAIVSEIAKIHRGALTLTARQPRGTRAAIEIPLTPEGAHAV
jgi:signal transduction histidine kinase